MDSEVTQRETQARGKPPEPTTKGEEAFFQEEKPRGHVGLGRRNSTVHAEALERALGTELGAQVRDVRLLPAWSGAHSVAGARGTPGRNEGLERGQGPDGEGVGVMLGRLASVLGIVTGLRTLARKEMGPIWCWRKLVRGSTEAGEFCSQRAGAGGVGMGSGVPPGFSSLPHRQDLAPKPLPLWGRHCTLGRGVQPAARGRQQPGMAVSAAHTKS